MHAACIEKKEFRLAQICGLNIVVHAVSIVFNGNFTLSVELPYLGGAEWCAPIL